MKIILLITAIALSMTLNSCSDESDNDPLGGGTTGDRWSIPKNEIKDGGPGKDGIPALLNPIFTDPADAGYLDDNDLVLGFVSGNSVKAYTHPVLDWHEIINDTIDGKEVAVNYCPLTGTGMAWSRVIEGQTTTFGVSGLLYNSNLIPYDRATDSNWSQMRLECVNGTHISKQPDLHQIVETTWKTWKEMYPQTKVVSEQTGYNRNYGIYPYGGYKSDNDFLLFPVSNKDDRLPGKQRVHGLIIGNDAKTYTFDLFGSETTLIHDIFNSKELIVSGNQTKNFIVSFFRKTSDGKVLEFEAIQNSLPIIMKDNEGNEWDLFGNAVSGPRKGEQLEATRSFIGFWFAWAAFYPGLELYQ